MSEKYANVGRLRDVLLDLVDRYPDLTYKQIFEAAAKFTGKSSLYYADRLTNGDIVGMLERFYDTHD